MAGQVLPLVLGGLTGGVALAAGAVTIVGRSGDGSDSGADGSGAGERHRGSRRVGAAMILWGAGQVLRVLSLAGDGHPFPGVGDVAQLIAIPLATAGVLALPQRSGAVHPAGRTLLDAGLLGAASGLLLWRLLFASGSGTALSGAGQLAVVATLLAGVTLCSAVVTAALRDLEAPLGVLAAGTTAYLVGDLALLYGGGTSAVPPGAPGALLWLVAWPLVAWGTARHGHGDRGRVVAPLGPADPDARVTVVTTVVALTLLLAGVSTLVLPLPGSSGRAVPVDPQSWVLMLATIGLLGVREMYHARTRFRLLTRLHEEATVDPLTGLSNRRVLGARLDEARADAQDAGRWCLVALDLDGFKGVNELLGHAVGDRLLRAVADRLVRSLPSTALVARTGADEFAVLLPGGLPTAVAAGNVVLTAVRRSCWDVEDVTRLPVTASVGVTTVGAGGSFSGLSAAGVAVQLAQAAGGDRVEVFDGAAAHARTRRLAVEERLRSAIREGEIDVRFQPVVDLHTGAMAGVEALARWVDPALGTINPQEFIPVAEQTGLVVALGAHVLDRTLAQAVEHGLPGRGIRVGWNVSPVQLRVPGFPQLVEDALARHGVPPDKLLVEVTEAVLVDEEGPAVGALRRLAEVGVTIAIDDFGTGYSALGYLRRLPVHILKIDRSLTTALADEPQARAIARAVVDLGSGLGVSVIVEGIETSDVAELVTAMGAAYGQGLLYGAPMPMADVVRLARRHPAATLLR